MKLLILTQKVDSEDPILGFFHRWIIEFSKHCEQVTVICLYKGEYKLPGNVKVLSLGKEQKISKSTYARNFYRLIWRERKNYDFVFVHMNQIYVILGGIFWHIFGKKVGLWYTHKNVSLSLRIAEKIVDIIFTASKESFRLASSKIHVMGHGIDTEIFMPRATAHVGNSPIGDVEPAIQMITIGRISPVKDYETLISALLMLKKEGKRVVLKIIGGTGAPDQEHYFKSLQEQVRLLELSREIEFVGSVSPRDIVSYFQKSDIFVSASNTGSLDKAVLEAMSCGIVPVTSNEAFGNMLSSKDLIFKKGDAADLAEKISALVESSQTQQLGKDLREIVVREHNISNLIPVIIQTYETGR